MHRHGQPLPDKGYHSFIEVLEPDRRDGHDPLHARRQWLGAYAAGASKLVQTMALVVLIGTVGQGALGAATVLSHLNPYIESDEPHAAVAGGRHRSASFSSSEATALVRGHDRPTLCRCGCGAARSIPALACGMLSSSRGRLRPHPGLRAGRILVRRLWSFQPAVFTGLCARRLSSASHSALLLLWLVRARGAATCAAPCSCSRCSPFR